MYTSLTIAYYIVIFLGSVLLDIEDRDISSIFHRIVDNLVLSEQVNEGDRGEILRSLFYDHW